LDASFEPKAVHDHFMELTKLYHPSGEEDRIREYVVERARRIEGVEVIFYEPDAKDPGKRVIVLRRKGSGNNANIPYVTLQRLIWIWSVPLIWIFSPYMSLAITIKKV
jgi:dipeptidase D